MQQDYRSPLLEGIYIWIIAFIFPIVTVVFTIYRIEKVIGFFMIFVIFIIIVAANICSYAQEKVLHFPFTVLFLFIPIFWCTLLNMFLIHTHRTGDYKLDKVIEYIFSFLTIFSIASIFFSIISIHIELLCRDRKVLKNSGIEAPPLWWGLVIPYYIYLRQHNNNMSLNLLWGYLGINIFAIPFFIGIFFI